MRTFDILLTSGLLEAYLFELLGYQFAGSFVCGAERTPFLRDNLPRLSPVSNPVWRRTPITGFNPHSIRIPVKTSSVDIKVSTVSKKSLFILLHIAIVGEGKPFIVVSSPHQLP